MLYQLKLEATHAYFCEHEYVIHALTINSITTERDFDIPYVCFGLHLQDYYFISLLSTNSCVLIHPGRQPN